MSKIDEVLSFLLDGEWHNLNEVAEALQIDCRKLEIILTFLAEFNLIQLDLSRVRITFEMKKFLKSLSEYSKEKGQHFTRLTRVRFCNAL